MKRLPGIKAGAPFQVYADFSFNGQPETFPAGELRAQVRDRAGRLLSELVPASDPSVPGRKWLVAVTTLGWPAGEVFFDIFRAGSATPYTETIAVPVERPQTRALAAAPSIEDVALAMPAAPVAPASAGAALGGNVARVVLGVPGVQRTVVVAQVQAGPRGLPGGVAPRQVIASEPLEPGDYVAFHQDGTAPRVRRASALLLQEAGGFVRTACAAGEPATVYGLGDENDAVGTVVLGPRWLSTTPGKCSATPPARRAGERVMVQRVGVAYGGNAVRFQAGEPLVLAPGAQ